MFGRNGRPIIEKKVKIWSKYNIFEIVFNERVIFAVAKISFFPTALLMMETVVLFVLSLGEEYAI